MTKLAKCSLLLLFASPLAAPAQPPPPILDMHLHAKDAPDPEREPPPKLCLPVTVYGVVDPQCADSLVAPTTDEAMVERTVEILERRNVFGVISDDSLETVARFCAAAPDRLIPGYELDLDGEDDLSPEEFRKHFVAGDFGVLGEIGLQYEGIAPDDERMEPYWALAEELDIPVALHLGEGYPGALPRLAQVSRPPRQPAAARRGAGAPSRPAPLRHALRLAAGLAHSSAGSARPTRGLPRAIPLTAPCRDAEQPWSDEQRDPGRDAAGQREHDAGHPRQRDDHR